MQDDMDAQGITGARCLLHLELAHFLGRASCTVSGSDFHILTWTLNQVGWLAESRCVKREVSRPQVADGYGRGSCEGQLLDADMGPQRRLRSTSGLPSRHGTAMWLGCYGDAMRRRWEGVVVRGARGLTFTENGPFI